MMIDHRKLLQQCLMPQAVQSVYDYNGRLLAGHRAEGQALPGLFRKVGQEL